MRRYGRADSPIDHRLETWRSQNPLCCSRTLYAVLNARPHVQSDQGLCLRVWALQRAALLVAAHTFASQFGSSDRPLNR